MANPPSSHPAKNTGRFGARATITRLRTPAMEPAVMTVRGPRRSMIRPTRIPVRPETTRASENAAMVAPVDQPLSAVICGFRTGKA
ncbi:hypothetical protein SNARM312S_03100 [Streptomyces narbonensis]